MKISPIKFALALAAVFAVVGIGAATVAFAPIGTALASANTADVAPASTDSGVVIVSLDAAGPAAKAGLMRGDIVLSADGTATDDARSLAAVVTAKKPGDKVSLEFTRGGNKQTLDVTLGDRAGRAYLGVSPAMGRIGRGGAFTHTLPLSGSHAFGRKGPFTATLAIETRVISVTSGSPAEKAGLQPGDLLLTVDGVTPTLRSPLAAMLGARKPGDVIRLAVQRGEQKLALTATLSARPDGKTGGWLGIAYAPGFARRERKPPAASVPSAGLRIGEVLAGSPAEKAGLAAGDIVRKLDGGDVTGMRALQSQLAAKKPGEAIRLTIERAGTTREINVTLGENPSDKTKAFIGIRFAGPPSRRDTPGQNTPAAPPRPASNL